MTKKRYPENPYINEHYYEGISKLSETEQERMFPTRPHGLTETQMLALPAIKWLLGEGPRASGRTYALAHALIQLAIENPGRPVYLFDHGLAMGVPYHIGIVRSSIPLVSRLITDQYDDYNFELKKSDNSLICLGIKTT